MKGRIIAAREVLLTQMQGIKLNEVIFTDLQIQSWLFKHLRIIEVIELVRCHLEVSKCNDSNINVCISSQKLILYDYRCWVYYSLRSLHQLRSITSSKDTALQLQAAGCIMPSSKAQIMKTRRFKIHFHFCSNILADNCYSSNVIGQRT